MSPVAESSSSAASPAAETEYRPGPRGAVAAPGPSSGPAADSPARPPTTATREATTRSVFLRVIALTASTARVSGTDPPGPTPPANATARRTTPAADPGAGTTGATAARYAGGPHPRRASRPASSSRPRACRLATVPSAIPSRAATSLRVSPPRSARTRTTRYRSGSRATSSSRAALRSARSSSGAGSAGTGLFSRARSLAARRRAARAVLRATPNSQSPTDERARTDPALRARTRKAAWKASSASWA